MTSTITDRVSGLGSSATPNGENATISIKVPVRVATTGNITLAGLQTIDGITLVVNDRVLVKDQTDQTKNGIYLASTDAWLRTADCADNGDLVTGTYVRVNEGATNIGRWYCSSANPIVIGTSSIVWSTEAGSGTVTSVGLTVPAGFSVSGSPIASAGTFAVTYAAGYSTPTDADQSNWAAAYGWGDHSTAGYLTSYTETDPVVGAVSGIVKADGAGNISAAVAGTDYLATEAYTGTVTSVAMTVPTGLAVTGSPVTSSGTLALAMDTGYAIPTTASQTNWNTAYGWGNHASAGYAASSHTHTASEVTDFDTEVSNNTDVAANTAARHSAVTLTGAGTYISLVGQQITVDQITESDISDLQSYLLSLVGDASPQLGGSLDVNGQKIVSTANGNIDIEPNGTGNVLLGNLVFDADQTVGAGQDNYVLTYDNSSGLISLEASAGGGGVGEGDSPTWTGAHDFGGATSVELPNGTAPTTDAAGEVAIDTNGVSPVNRGVMQYHDGTSNLYLWGTSNTPSSDNDVMVYDSGSNSIVWEAQSGGGGGTGITDVVQDTTPQLGGMLDVNGFAIGDGTRELLTFTEDPSAVNQINIENKATGSGPILSAAGDDTNIDLVLSSKGTGQVKVGSDRVLTTADSSSFAAASHTHAISDVTNLQTTLDNKQPLDADLTAIGALAGTSGFLKKTGANTWTLDTSTYLTSETYTGTVTSVAMTVPTGLAVSGSPITTSGTLAVTLQSGYSIPTTASQTNWNTAYGWGNHASAGYAAASHTHAISDVTNLQTTLDGKQPLASVLTNTTASFTTALETKLNGIETAANVTDATNVAAAGAAMTSGATFTGQVTVKETAETNYNLTGTDVDPANGTMQYKTTTGSETLTGSNFANGQSVTLRLTAATAVTFTGFNWVSSDGAAPTIASNNDVFILWQDNGTKFVAYVGNDG